MPELTNRQILLRRRPTGLVQPDDTELVTNPAPEPADGEALVRTTYIGMDAAARTWLDGQPGYLPALQLGDVIRAAGIGEVVASRCDAYAVGDVVTTLTGFQEYVIIRDDVFTTPIPGETDQLAIMSVYGPTGATAYFGMTDIGRPQPGETVVVSAAAGATGSVAGQIAKIAGARVVGIAGGPHKCKAVVEDFGFDACIDYKEANLPASLKEHCPKGVNVYFDNVGGADPRRGAGPAGPEGTGRALRRHFQLPDRGTPRPRQLRQLACEDRAHAGIQCARRVGPLRRSLRLAAPVGGGWPARAPPDHLRRHRIVRRRPQRAVHRRQHRQDAGQCQRTHARLMPKLSAGLLLYRVTDGGVEVLIGHPGGPFWARKDEGAWSIPKGEYVEGEDPWTTAQREFHEELGKAAPDGPRIDFAPLKQPSGKVITAFAVRGDLDLEGTVSNTFELEWPKGSGNISEYPEIDRVGWFSVAEAHVKLLKGQRPLLDRLMAALERGEPGLGE